LSSSATFTTNWPPMTGEGGRGFRNRKRASPATDEPQFAQCREIEGGSVLPERRRSLGFLRVLRGHDTRRNMTSDRERCRSRPRARNPAHGGADRVARAASPESTGSAGGLALSRAGRQARLLALARPPMGDGAAGIAHVRDAEFRRAQLHRTLVGEAMARDGEYVERQAALRRLARTV